MNEQVFISYSSKDSEWAEEMARILKENGISYWKAPESIPPGGNYNIEIPKGIERCPIFLVLLSENAAASEYVPNELDLAKTEHKYIIPVQISEYDSYVFKLALVNKQVYPWKDIDRIINQIWQQLRMPRAEVRRPQSTSAAPQPSVHSNFDRPNFAEYVQVSATSSSGRPAWIKWAIAACAVLVLGIAGGMVLRGMLGQGTAQGEPGGSFGGGRDKGSVVSTAPADEPERNSEAVASAAPAPVPDTDKPTKLTKLHIMESDYASVKEDATNSVGQVYDEALHMYSAFFGPPYASYYLGGEYSWFSGTLSCPDEVGSGYTYTFQVCLDGNEEEPAFEIEMSRGTPPTPLEIDISGYQTITFRTVGESAGAMISDGLLYGKDADLSAIRAAVPQQAAEIAKEEKKAVKLTKLHIMEGDYASIKEDAVNSVGQSFGEAVHMYSAFFGPPYARFYLGGEYSRFTGTLSCPVEVGSGYTYTFQVCLDGSEDEPAFEIEMGRATPPTPLDIDVSGCQIITFRTIGESAGAMISDGLLTP